MTLLSRVKVTEAGVCKGSGTESSANVTAGVGDMQVGAFGQGLARTRARRWRGVIGRSGERTYGPSSGLGDTLRTARALATDGLKLGHSVPGSCD